MNADAESEKAALPHCKGNDGHVHVAVIGAHETVTVIATHIDAFACENTSYTGPGVVLSHRLKQPLSGLHLLPDLIAVLPTQLRDAATEARAMPGTHTVAITHTSLKVFVLFAALTPAGADGLADAIEATA